MRTRFWLVAALPLFALAGAAHAQQYPVVDKVADKVVQKYQTATCEQLWQEKAAKAGQPKSPAEQRAIQLLHGDPGMQAEFFARVSTPIVTKMFQCGMIP